MKIQQANKGIGMENLDLPNPFSYLLEIRNERRKRKEFEDFYRSQFRRMVQNGQVEKAVELIWDEARNLDYRLEKKVEPEALAAYCLDRCMEEASEENDFMNTARLIRENYEIKVPLND